MSERKMCHDCPHRREHEVGDETVFFPEHTQAPHPCHNAPSLRCVGHQMQFAKAALGEVVLEDVMDKRVIHTPRRGRAWQLALGGRDAEREEGAA